MIFLLFLAGFVLWLTVTIMLSKRIPHWLGVTKHTKVASVMLFPLVLTAPIADELIGRWQFNRLCEREAVVTLSPDWEKVKRARRVSLPRSEVAGALIRIYSQGGEYVDVDTGKTFMTYPYFYTYGGLLFGRLGLGLGGSTSCLPKNAQAIEKMINFYELLKQGGMK
jgi:hypothetical protein